MGPDMAVMRGFRRLAATAIVLLSLGALSACGAVKGLAAGLQRGGSVDLNTVSRDQIAAFGAPDPARHRSLARG